MSLPTHLATLLVAAITLQTIPAVPAEAQEYITRAETVLSLILARSPDFPAVRNELKFSDVPKGAWFEPTMLLAEKYGIISSVDGKLQPQATVNRAEFLKMLTFTFGLPVNLTYTYDDVPARSWFAQYAGIAHHYKLFDATNKLEPAKLLTRTEMLTALRTVERIRENESMEQNIAKNQSKEQLKIYNVISTRRVRVTLVEPEPKKNVSVRRVSLSSPSTDVRTAILKLVNDIRAQNNLPALKHSTLLEQSAQAYADRMAKEGFFAHVSPDGDTLKDRITATGYYDRSFSEDCRCVKGYALGENLARGQKTAQEAVDAWMKSPSHRDAILNPDYADLGVGVSAGVWVQHFGGVILPGK